MCGSYIVNITGAPSDHEQSPSLSQNSAADREKTLSNVVGE